MPRITPIRPVGQNLSLHAVLSLLSLFCQSLGHTFSWYTSQKGRTWLAFKNNHGVPYSTSTEYTGTFSEEQTLGTFAILLAAHMGKALEITPPIPTWHGGKHTSEDYTHAWEQLRAYYAEALPIWQAQGMAIPEPIHLVLGTLNDEPTS